MLNELHVRNLGVVVEANLVLEPGMTAITGETGAGKTMLTESIRLLLGGKADAHVVRIGSNEARIDGRFLAAGIDLATDEPRTDDEIEVVLSRVVPADGRSRAYRDGTMSPLTRMQELGSELVDLHGQHEHQTLLATAAQRRALDAFGAIDTTALNELRREVQRINRELEEMGGDARARAREIDLLAFQDEELTAAELVDGDEDARLLAEETTLADAEAHRNAAAAVHDALAADGGAVEALATAVRAAQGRVPLAALQTRLTSLVAELDDIGLEAAAVVEHLSDDPERLAFIQDRRAVLKALMRKYGATLAEVMTYRDEVRDRLDRLRNHDDTVAQREADRDGAQERATAEARRIGAARRKVATTFAREVEVRLRELALPAARFEVAFGDDDAADDVTFLLGPNPGLPLLPIAKAASGGELARAMLALRLALLASRGASEQPDTLIFDEVDAGIGGEAALAVGRALASVARTTPRTQVFVVTHLAQVAAFADHQISVRKSSSGDVTVSALTVLDDAEREIELARMLSGNPDSTSGRTHARELMAQKHAAPAPAEKAPRKSPPRKKAAAS